MQASQSSAPLRLIAPPFFPSTPQDQAQPSHKPILCKLYPTPQGCSFGQACRFMHEKPGDVSLRNAKPGQWEKRVAKERKALNDKHSKGARARSGELISRFERLVGETKALPAGSGTKVSNKTCKFFQAGYCSRASACHFKHPEPTQAEIEAAKGSDADADADATDPFHPVCGICYDQVEKYGLLKDCSHVFCFDCIHNWRTRSGKSPEAISNMAAMMKTCPLCRQRSPFITPSSLFHAEGPRKTEVIDTYKKVLSQIPCRYLAQSIKTSDKKAFCPFGDECHYSHERNGKRVIFHATAAQNMPKLRNRRAYRVGTTGGVDLLQAITRAAARTDQAHMLADYLHEHENNAGAGSFAQFRAAFEANFAAAIAATTAPEGIDVEADGEQGTEEEVDGTFGRIRDVLGPDGASIVIPRANILPSGQPVAQDWDERSEDEHSLTLEEHFDLDIEDALEMVQDDTGDFEGDWGNYGYQDEFDEFETHQGDDWGDW